MVAAGGSYHSFIKFQGAEEVDADKYNLCTGYDPAPQPIPF